MKNKTVNSYTSIIAFIIFLFILPANGFSTSKSDSSYPFELSILTDSVTAGTGALFYGAYFTCDKLLKIKNENSNINNYDINSFNLNDVNKFDRLFAKPYSHSIDKISDVLAAVTILSPAFLGFSPQPLSTGIMYAETMLISYSLKCLGKFIFDRTRPYMYFAGYPEKDVNQGDWNDSFPSAHATMAFAAATFSTYVFASIYPDSKWKYGVAALSYSAAVAVSAMRITSGCHFMTDILTGAAIGSLCGFIVPYVHTLNNKNKNSPYEISASPLGFNIAVNF